MHRYVLGTALFSAIVGVASLCAAEEKIARENLGRGVKLRILVDKVMQPEADWVTEEWMVRATAEAGFNVWSPRLGHDRLDEVRRVTEWCTRYGIYHMPWMRGSLSAPPGPKADGKRLVWAGGGEQPLWSPNADEFWEWTTRYIVEYAKISAKNKHLMGVFLDYENYAPGRREGNLYSLSYDELILTKFAESKGIELAKLDPAKRKPWLQAQGLDDEFAAFQIDHWRERCRALREAVDAIEPTFQFCIYPAPGTPLMVEATYPEWATEEAPLILADASTYGRSSRFVPEQEALRINREKLLQRMEVPKEAGIPFIYAGGIDPVVRGADAEFSGKNAVAIAEVTDGYWIFYEGPTYTKPDHADYWKWFTWANRAIADGDFQAQHQARETPEDWTLALFDELGDRPKLVAPKGTGGETEYPIVKMRRDNLLLLGCKAGQPVSVTLQNQPVAHYKSLLAWDVRDDRLAKIASGMIPHGGSDTIAFTPASDGIYLLGASAGGCAYSLTSANVPVGLYAGEPCKFIHGVKRLYLHVPDGVDEFTLAIEGAAAETVRVNVFDPEGAQVASGQTTVDKAKTVVNVAAGDQAGKVWSLELTRADEGVLEDCSIGLDARLVPVLSLVPEQVFDFARKD